MRSTRILVEPFLVFLMVFSIKKSPQWDRVVRKPVNAKPGIKS